MSIRTTPPFWADHVVERNVLTRKQQIAKLELIVDTAAEVWGD